MKRKFLFIRYYSIRVYSSERYFTRTWPKVVLIMYTGDRPSSCCVSRRQTQLTSPGDIRHETRRNLIVQKLIFAQISDSLKSTDTVLLDCFHSTRYTLSLYYTLSSDMRLEKTPSAEGLSEPD